MASKGREYFRCWGCLFTCFFFFIFCVFIYIYNYSFLTNKWKHQGNQIYEQIFVSALIEVINNIIIAYCRFKDNWFDHCLSACNYCDYNGRELVLYRLLQREIHLTTDINFGGKGKGIADLKLKRWNHKLIRLLKIRIWQKKSKNIYLKHLKFKFFSFF